MCVLIAIWRYWGNWAALAFQSDAGACCDFFSTRVQHLSDDGSQNVSLEARVFIQCISEAISTGKPSVHLAAGVQSR